MNAQMHVPITHMAIAADATEEPRGTELCASVKVFMELDVIGCVRGCVQVYVSREVCRCVA